MSLLVIHTVWCFRKSSPLQTVTTERFLLSANIAFHVDIDYEGIFSRQDFILGSLLYHTYFLLFRNRETLTNSWQCAVCGSYFRSFDGVLDATKVVTCRKCEVRVCRQRCSGREHPGEGWTCNICRKDSNSWFKGILEAIQPNYKKGELKCRKCEGLVWTQHFFLGVRLRTTMSTSGRLEEIDEDLMKLRKKEKEQVRDFIERLVSTMLGGDVDDTCVTKLYNDPHCKKKLFIIWRTKTAKQVTSIGEIRFQALLFLFDCLLSRNQNTVDVVDLNVLADDVMFRKYHSDLSTALTDLGSALHMSIASKCRLFLLHNACRLKCTSVLSTSKILESMQYLHENSPML